MWPAADIILSSYCVNVSPFCNAGSTFHSRRNKERKVRASVWLNFRPMHARRPIPNIVTSGSDIPYHLEGRNSSGVGKARGFRSIHLCSSYQAVQSGVIHLRIPIMSIIIKEPFGRTIVDTDGFKTLTWISSAVSRVSVWPAAEVNEINHSTEATVLQSKLTVESKSFLEARKCMSQFG